MASALALHFELGHDFPKAVRYLGLAAESSARRFSTREAASYLTRALELVPILPADVQAATRLKLLLQRAWAWRAGGDFCPLRSKILLPWSPMRSKPDIFEKKSMGSSISAGFAFTSIDGNACRSRSRHWQKAARSDDAAFRALVQGNVANLYLMLRGWRTEDADFCRQAAELIAESQDLSMRMRRCSMEMVLEFLSSNYQRAATRPEEGRELARMVGDVYLFVLYNTVEAFALLYLGRMGPSAGDAWPPRWRSQSEMSNAQASVLCQLTIGWLHAEAQDFERAASRAEETLNPIVEAIPFSFFVGRTLLARAYIGLRNLPWRASSSTRWSGGSKSTACAMESLVIPHYLLNCCDYWLEAGDLDQAQKAAARLHEVTATAPDRPFLALSHNVMARISDGEREIPDRQIAFVPGHLDCPQCAGCLLRPGEYMPQPRSFYESSGEPERAAKFRRRSDQIVRSLTNSLEPNDSFAISGFVRRQTSRKAG